MFRQRRLGEAAAPPPPSSNPTPMPGDVAGATRIRYRLVEKLASIGDDFFIQNDQGQRVFKVDGKALRARDTLMIQDLSGTVLCKIQQRMARLRDSIEIEGPEGNQVASVQKAMIAPLRDRFVVKISDGPDLVVHGNVVAHEYRISNAATVSKKWFRVRDSYGVEIAPGQNDVLILAATVCIDQLSNDIR